MSNLSVTRGDDRTFVTGVTDLAGNPADISGALGANFTVKRSPADDTAVISKSLGTGVDIPVPASGIIETTLTASDTVVLHGPYVFELELIDSANLRTTVDHGSLMVMHDLNSAAVEDTFLREGDYDAVRFVLGVTELDVTDEHIEMLPYAPTITRMIKARVSNWQTQIANAESLAQIRTATIYGVVASIAESAAQGGFLGLTERWPRPRNPLEWRRFSEWAWTQYEVWTGAVEAGDTEPEALYDLPGVKMNGPSRAAGTPYAWWDYPPVYRVTLP